MTQIPRSRALHQLVGAAALALATLGATLAAAGPAGAQGTPYLSGLSNVSEIASTVPTTPTGALGTGDVNPYGMAVVPKSLGHLVAGDVLVSNFNDAANNQGTGRTIVQISPSGSLSVFARIGGKAVGLTTALGILPGGYVIVGSLPTSNGQSATARAGALYVLNDLGSVVKTIRNDIDGPWDLTVAGSGKTADVFVTNVLNGTVAGDGRTVHGGTVVRLVLSAGGGIPKVLSTTIIGSDFAETTNPQALVIGPTGVALSNGTLYVADTLNSVIRAIPNALHRTSTDLTGSLVTKSPGMLEGPLGLIAAPNGDLLTVNSGNGDIIEVTPAGAEVASVTLDTSGTPPGAGALFGLALAPSSSVYFVDDATNELDLLAP
jgi:hypothetical protein